jgi:hypothetical protein
MSEIKVYIFYPCHSESKGTDETNEYIFASLDGRADMTVICNVDSTYVLSIYCQSMTICHMANLLIGVSMVS